MARINKTKTGLVYISTNSGIIILNSGIVITEIDKSSVFVYHGDALIGKVDMSLNKIKDELDDEKQTKQRR